MGVFDFYDYDFSTALLAFYLSNPGPTSDYSIQNDHFQKVVATADVQSKVTEALVSITEQARRDPQLGVLRELTSDWLPAGPTEDGDVAYGIGHFSVAVGSDTVVRESADGLRAEIAYKVYVWDYYNFDTTTWQPFGNLKLNMANEIGNHMRELEEFGWARSFVARGQSASVETRNQLL